MKIQCTKSEAAVRQIDTAIALLFSGGDPLAVRTLAGAAHGILADLAETQCSGSSWRTKLIEDSGLSTKSALQILNATQNYLKHADRDPSSSLSFDDEENSDLLFIASLECGGLGHQLSISMQAFQIWYLALYPEKVCNDTDLVETSRRTFPALPSQSRSEQLSLGKQFLEGVSDRQDHV